MLATRTDWISVSRPSQSQAVSYCTLSDCTSGMFGLNQVPAAVPGTSQSYDPRGFSGSVVGTSAVN